MGYEVVEWVHVSQNMGPVVGPFEHGNVVFGCVKGERFLYQLRNLASLERPCFMQLELSKSLNIHFRFFFLQRICN
jgi:hypothetical protein